MRSVSSNSNGGASRSKLVDDDTLIVDNDTDDSSSMSGDDNDHDNDHDMQQEDSDRGEGFRFRVRGIKRVMKALMKRHGGSTRHPRVTKMIHKLEKMNPTHQPARSDLLVGDFIAHSSPDFPGRIRPRRSSRRGRGGDNNNDGGVDAEEVVQYTLGRLSFGIFQPHNLVCTVRAVRNSIQVCDDEELLRRELSHAGYPDANGDLKSFFYPIIIDLTIHTPEGVDLDAEMRHEALCYEMPNQETRLGVTFLGGSLVPSHAVRSNPELLEVWKQTFANAYKTADEERSYMGRFMRVILKWYLQLATPTDEDAEQCELHSARYEMKRRPKGHLDVLYLDEELRVTRGNRGTLIVVERLPYAQQSESPASSSPSSSQTPRPHPSH